MLLYRTTDVVISRGDFAPCWRTHFFGTDYTGLRQIFNPTTKRRASSFSDVDFGWKGTRLDT
jgi:hypothetical protein